MKHLLALAMLISGPAAAEPVAILDVQPVQNNGTWRFDVRVEHPDTGWDHYADGWRIEDASGNILGTRVLGHPHVNEMPFTRSLSGVAIPEGITEVFVRARCLVDGWNETTTRVDLN